MTGALQNYDTLQKTRMYWLVDGGSFKDKFLPSKWLHVMF